MRVVFLILVLGLLIPLEAQTIKWYTAEKGFAKAAKEKKLVLVDIYTDWCGWCKKMDKETYANKSVAKALNKNFVCVKYNPEKDGNIMVGGKVYKPNAFESMANVAGYPATAFFSSSGEFIQTVVGFMDQYDLVDKIIRKILRK